MSLEEEQHAGAQVYGSQGQLETGAPIENAEQDAAPSQEDAAFLEGFEAAQGDESGPEPEPVKMFGKYTEAEAIALLDRVGEVDRLKEREQKMFGHLGSLKQQMDQMRSQPTQAGATRLDTTLRRVSAEYPEMAEALREDLQEALQGGGSGVDTASLERIVTERLEVAGKVNEQKLLSVMHPDWRRIAPSQEFAQWKGTLAPNELQVIDDSWDAISVGESLSRFKAWRTQTYQAAQAKQQRQSRLEAAVTPRGGQRPTPAQTETDAFFAGFKSVRGS